MWQLQNMFAYNNNKAHTFRSTYSSSPSYLTWRRLLLFLPCWVFLLASYKTFQKKSILIKLLFSSHHAMSKSFSFIVFLKLSKQFWSITCLWNKIFMDVKLIRVRRTRIWTQYFYCRFYECIKNFDAHLISGIQRCHDKFMTMERFKNKTGENKIV